MTASPMRLGPARAAQPRPSPVSAAGLCTILLSGLVLLTCRFHATAPSPRQAGPGSAREVAQERFDQPDAAELYYRAKRRPLDPSVTPVAAYEIAARRRLTMPRHSLVLNATAESLAEARALGSEVAKLPAWESLGPGNIGGRMRGFVIHPTNPNVMYACGVSGGVWKTTDGGASWATATDQLANIAFNSLAMSPANPDVLYGGTGEGYFREEARGTGLPLRGAGIFVTSDAGATWARLTSTETEDFYWVNDIVVSRTDPRRIYAATRTGVWRSADEGASWTRVLATSVKGGCLDLAMRSDMASDFLFASCGTFDQATVYRCRAAEATGGWESVLSERGMGRTSLAIAPSDQRVVYALSASNVPSGTNPYTQGLFAVYRSSDEGAAGSWSARVRNTNPNPLDNLILTNPIAANSVLCQWEDPQDIIVNMGWYCNVIAVDPADPDIVWTAGVDLFRSDDGGRNWGIASYWWPSPQQPSFVHADQHNIVFHPGYDGVSNQTMYVANDGGVYRTDSARATVGRATQDLCDPGHSAVRFVALNHALGVTQFYHGAVFPGANRYLGGTQDNGTILGSDAAGPERWRMIYGGDGGYAAIDPNSPSTIYAQAQGFDLQKSTDGGATFAPSRRGIPGSEAFIFIAPFTMDPNDSRTLWTGGIRLWRSEDGARWWVQASAIFDGNSQASAIAVAPGRSERVIVGTNSGKILRSDAARSSSAATNWSWSQPRTGFVTWVAFDPADPDVVYATYGGFGGPHLYRSSDGGQSFESMGTVGASPIPDVPVHCVLADPGRRSRLFLGTDIGVLVSEDGGDTWAVENTGFASAVTEYLTLGTGNDGSRYLFAFTHGRGAWRVKLPAGEPAGPSRRPRRHLGR